MASSPSQSQVKPEFWRIRGIEIGDRDAATEWLREQVQEVEIWEGEGFSLAADSERTLCATVTAGSRPSPPNRRWRVDKDFIGFTPLHDPEDAEVDIVAVTGLGGHALGSFRSSDGTSVWLRDFGPQDIPKARWITYGYDSAVVASDSNQGIRELAHTLLDALAAFRRRTRTLARPLCFICHSLGGVVLKEALVISSKTAESESPEHYQVARCTHGFILMGVPNLGLRHPALVTLVECHPNENFIRDLQTRQDGEPSQFLSYLTGEFANLCRQQTLPWKIVSYYETKRSTTVEASGSLHQSLNHTS